VTGYGEDLIKSAFGVDVGIVETIAHYHAAHYFNPHVDFILDIGGQDMKCFKLKNGIVDSIMLNEACSSGCGSFIETFAHALGYDVEAFAKLGINSKHPVNLGSRCTVFMNSSVKQSQKDGASIEDISAGLAVSVIKNAIYKVMGTSQASELGENIVVQGGTFLNDPILRAFEREINKNVTRPAIAGLMGAYGAALYGMGKYNLAIKTNNNEDIVSKLLSVAELDKFTHSARIVECGLCTNNCKLTVNTFNKGEKFISGNRCERPTGKKLHEEIPNAYDYKMKKLISIANNKDKSNLAGKQSRGKIGILFGLNMFENLPFWYTFFTELGFEVILSKVSTRELYIAGQHTIPSDTVCYPAKLMHGHIEDLLAKGVKTIFYPCIPYNFDEKAGDNHYNCPVVAYYPELLGANIGRLSQTGNADENIDPEIKYLTPYFSLHNRRFFYRRAAKYMKETFGIKKKNEVIFAAQRAYSAYEKYKREVHEFGDEAVKYARDNGKGIIILAGRPYHIDPEVNHGIDKVITSLGMVLISEDCLRLDKKREKLKVLNQWTYHSRLYNAAHIASKNKDMNLVQMVSFGCGLDAITTGEVKDILERNNKIFTQIKIDEINNLGAAKIRLRSLIEAIEAHKEEV
jgi:predicted CoA-substrate-specific enzyme activase